jgi:polyisoprenoid-binding protein YceI
MKLFATLAGVGVAVISAVAAAETYTIDSRHTYPMFEVNHLGITTQRGRFNSSAGKIMLDRSGKKGSVELTIDTNSIDMGLAKWDEHMKSEDFFDAAKHPQITFKSSKLKFDGDKIVGADGEFTLRGVTKPLSVSVAGFNCIMHPMLKKEACGGDVTATIKRSQFGMDYALPAVGDEVKLMIPVEALKD